MRIARKQQLMRVFNTCPSVSRQQTPQMCLHVPGQWYNTNTVPPSWFSIIKLRNNSTTGYIVVNIKEAVCKGLCISSPRVSWRGFS